MSDTRLSAVEVWILAVLAEHWASERPGNEDIGVGHNRLMDRELVAQVPDGSYRITEKGFKWTQDNMDAVMDVVKAVQAAQRRRHGV